METTEWSEELILSLLKEVQNYPCIWDPKHKHYRNKKQRTEGYTILSELCDKPVTEIRRKFQILLQTYRLYRRKMHIDKECVTNWYGYDMIDSFFHDIYSPKPAGKADGVDMADELPPEGEEYSDAKQLIEHVKCEEEDSNSDDPLISITGRTEITPEKVFTPLPINRKRKIITKRQPEVARTSSSYEVRVPKVQLMEEIQNNCNPDNDNRKGECELFGEFVTSQVKKLDDVSRQYAMHEINNILFTFLIEKMSPLSKKRVENSRPSALRSEYSNTAQTNSRSQANNGSFNRWESTEYSD